MTTEKNEAHVAVSHIDDEVVILASGKRLDVSKADEALQFALSDAKLDAAAAKRILWKTDLFLLPVLCLLYCFQFMDKLLNSYASILGLRTDLHMEGNQYLWTGTAFYLGYLVFEFPASLLLQRFPVAKTAAVFIVLWGVILCLHAVPQYAGFIALRTILGMLELSVTPAFTIITLQWYTRDEQFLRIAFWFACNGLGTIVGSGIAYGLATHELHLAIALWKLVFVVTGVLTIALGFVVFVHIPDNPAKAWFLTPEERYLVVERIRVNQQGFGNRRFKRHQFVEALTDYRTWLMAIFVLVSNIPNGGTTNFGSILLHESMGYSVEKSLLMQMPGGAVEIVGCILLAFCATKVYRLRFLWGTIGLAINLAAQCLLAFGKDSHLQYAGFTLINIAAIGFICMLSVMTSNVAGHTKKVTTNAIFLIGYCVGNVVGPQTFKESQAPDYNGAKLAIVICGAIALALMVAIWGANVWENTKKERLNDEGFDNCEFADLTDRENPRFRYST
jgi:ACS family allantoate permease-like MFS transporter